MSKNDIIMKKPQIIHFTFLCCILSILACPSKEFDWERDNIEENITISGTVYYEGIIRVTNGSKLTISPGSTLIFSSSQPSALVIEQGSKIDAKGTEEAPITFTSDEEKEGSWGGVIILGRSRVLIDNKNFPIDTDKISPGTNFNYGGNFNEDNSGNLCYVRILFAGGVSRNDIEQSSIFNGLTLCGVGSSTKIDYVQVHKSGRDAFAVFGGTANLRHIVATGSKEDGFYSDEAWKGQTQFYVAQMSNGTRGNGIEIRCDTWTADFVNEWNDSNDNCNILEGPRFYNVTIAGDENDRDKENHAIRIEPNGHGKFKNCIFYGFSKPFSIDATGWNTYNNIDYSQIQTENPSNTDIEIPTTSAEEKAFFLGHPGTLPIDNDFSTLKLRSPLNKTNPDFSAIEYIEGLKLEFDLNDPCSSLFRSEGGPYKFKGAVGNNPNDPTTRDWTKGWTTYP